MLGCWDFNGKKGPYFKQNHRKCTNQGSEGGTKKKSSSELQLLVNTQRPIIHV